MATEPIDLEAIRRAADCVIAPHESGFFGYATAHELASHILALLAELARLSRSEAEIRARVAGEIEAAMLATRAEAEQAAAAGRANRWSWLNERADVLAAAQCIARGAVRSAAGLDPADAGGGGEK